MSAQKNKAGYFSPESMIWRVSRETALLLGGGRALLMQVAHPLVAAGVTEHSSYQAGPWRRLEHTLDAMGAIIFGSREEADQVATHVRKIHATVNGTLKTTSGVFPAGTVYDASDPELLMWVHATLVDSSLLSYQALVGPLNDAEQEEYYQEMKVVAKLFGVTEEALPADLAAFRVWLQARLASDEICVTPAALEVAEAVFHPPLPLLAQPAMRVLGMVTTGLLPEKLQQEYRLSLPPLASPALRVSRTLTRRLLMPLLPDLLRAGGTARIAEGKQGISLHHLLASLERQG